MKRLVIVMVMLLFAVTASALSSHLFKTILIQKKYSASAAANDTRITRSGNIRVTRADDTRIIR